MSHFRIQYFPHLEGIELSTTLFQLRSLSEALVLD